MALFGKFERTTTPQRGIAPLWQQVLVIPEATVLIALLLIGWAFNFPAGLGFLVMLVVGVFVVRLWLITTAARQLHRGAYHRADRFASAALRLNPWSVDALQLRAEGYAMQGDDAAAEPILRRAVELAPQQHVVHATFTATLLAQGQMTEAHGRLAYAGVPQSPVAIQQKAWYALHVEGNLDVAHRMLVEAQPLQLPASQGVALLITLADAELARQNSAEAQRLVQEIMQRLPYCPQPQQAELHYHLGRLNTALGGEGTLHFRQSVALDPQGRYAHSAWRSAMGQHPTIIESRSVNR